MYYRIKNVNDGFTITAFYVENGQRKEEIIKLTKDDLINTKIWQEFSIGKSWIIQDEESTYFACNYFTLRVTSIQSDLIVTTLTHSWENAHEVELGDMPMITVETIIFII